jgi:hypothetical protein
MISSKFEKRTETFSFLKKNERSLNAMLAIHGKLFWVAGGGTSVTHQKYAKPRNIGAAD